MKTILFLLLILFSCLIFAQKRTVVAGKIFNAKSNSVEVKFADPDHYDLIVHKTKLSKDGSFLIEFPLENPEDGYLTNEEFTPLYICPGDSIYVTVDAKQFDESVIFSGDGAEIQRYLLNRLILFDDPDTTKKIDTKYRTNLPPEEYLSQINRLRKKEICYLNEYFSSYPGNEEFIRQRTIDLYYNSYENLISYYSYYRQKTKASSPVFPEVMCILNSLDSLDLRNKTFLLNDNFKYFLHYYIKFYKYPIYKKPELNFYENNFYVSRQFLTGEALDFMLYLLLVNNLSAGTVEEMTPQYEDFLITCKNQEYIEEVSDKYNSFIIHAKNPKIPEKSLVYTNKHDESNELTLEKLIQKHKGKVIYMDFWASWCSSCIQMMNPAAELHEKYRDKDMVFIYCSIDRNENAWLSAISKYKIEGIHYRINPDTDEELYKQFSIKGVPRYVLFSKDGYIRFFDATIPTDPTIENIFDSLLSE